MNIAVIPARGGSKRIPRKNIKIFGGKPMIAWSIEAALKSNCFDQVIVSTDDDEIAKVAEDYGAIVPFIRPPELSDDYTSTLPVVQHAINYLENQGNELAFVCCIYATAPFLSIQYLQDGEQALQQTQKNYAFSATSYPFPIQRAIKLCNDGVEMFQPEYFNTRSQDLEEAYHDAGQFYWGRKEAWLSGISAFSTKSTAIVLPRHLVQDIDTPEDWVRAELMFVALK